jgi:antitoxin Phd
MKAVIKRVSWQLQDAKNRFSELVNEAERSGPQIVTRRGSEAAVVLSYRDYQKLAARGQRGTLIDALLSAPKVPGGLRLERSRDVGRKVDLG